MVILDSPASVSILPSLGACFVLEASRLVEAMDFLEPRFQIVLCCFVFCVDSLQGHRAILP